MECPKLLARVYPEPSEPVLGADFPPQAIINFLHLITGESSFPVDKVNFSLDLWIDFTL